MMAGRTGTRLNIGRPQPRWEEGVALAESVLQTRDSTVRGNQPLGIATRIREAVNIFQEFLSGQRNVANQ